MDESVLIDAVLVSNSGFSVLCPLYSICFVVLFFHFSTHFIDPLRKSVMMQSKIIVKRFVGSLYISALLLFHLGLWFESLNSFLKIIYNLFNCLRYFSKGIATNFNANGKWGGGSVGWCFKVPRRNETRGSLKHLRTFQDIIHRWMHNVLLQVFSSGMGEGRGGGGVRLFCLRRTLFWE